jgi:hypothetical protein
MISFLLLLKLTELVASQKRSCSQNISKNLWINEYILKAERGQINKMEALEWLTLPPAWASIKNSRPSPHGRHMK